MKMKSLKRSIFITFLCISFIFSISIIGSARLTSPEIKDVVIGDPSISYKDPEFWLKGHKVAWQDENNFIWLADVDPDTGLWKPANGKGQKIGTAAPIETTATAQGTWNGPEWGFSKMGASVYYTAIDTNGVYQIARYRLYDKRSDFLTFGGKNNRSGVLPSKDLTDNNARIMYFMNRFKQGIGHWQYENKPETETTFPSANFASSGPQWIDGEKAIATNFLDKNGIQQIVKYSIENSKIEFLTTDPGTKYDVYFFQAQEFNQEKMFLCTIDDTKIGIYRNINKSWKQIYLIKPPLEVKDGQKLTIFSAEPFTFQNHTFISYAASFGKPYSSPSWIFVTSIDGKWNQEISPHDKIARIDPEYFPTEKKVFIYYYTVENRSRKLHLCEFVPLAPEKQTINDKEIGSSTLSYVDNEYDLYENRMAWMDSQFNIWLCHVNPDSGELIPDDGRESLIGKGAPFALAVNSLDWEYSKQGSAVYSVTKDSNLIFQIFRTYVDKKPFQQEQITSGTLANYGMIPSLNKNDVMSSLIFGQGKQPVKLAKPLRAMWMYENNFSDAKEIIMDNIGSSGARWIPKEHSLSTTVKIENTLQIAKFDLDCNKLIQLTFDKDNKSDPFFFEAPEYSGENLFMCLTNNDSFSIYRSINGQYQKINQIKVNAKSPYNETISYISPEPFSFQGKSYFFVVCYFGPKFISNSEIWVCSIDGNINQRVSDNTPLPRHDPEAFVTKEKCFISYYTNFLKDSRLHICELILD